MPATDPIVPWHLRAIRADRLAPDRDGSGVTIAILDDGVDADHPGLAPGYDGANDFDAASGAEDGRPRRGGAEGDAHGTAVAGLAAARAGSEAGVRGVAPGATILSIRMPFTEIEAGEVANDPAFYATAFARSARADIANNSWGDSTGVYSVHDAAWRPAFAALSEAVRLGRGGLGTVFLFAAGNERELQLDTNFSNLTNLHETITVAATARSGAVAGYSTPGASVLIAAPAGNLTTDRPGAEGYNDGSGGDLADPDFTNAFGGTSAATPVASGVVALLLEAEPELGYRDVKEILAASARRLPSVGDWQQGTGSFWNGGALAMSQEVGGGLIDAAAALRMAETWLVAGREAQREANLVVQSVAGTPVGDGFLEQGSPVEIRFAVQAGRLERLQEVELDLAFEHDLLQDLRITLTSPSGALSVLLDRPPAELDGEPGVTLGSQWRFGSTQHWGEDPTGTWVLRLEDLAAGDSGRVEAASLRLLGPAASEDDRYVFTDDFRTFNQGGPILDTGGFDILDLSATSRGARVDLAPGATSNIAGRPLRLDEDTVIEMVIGGAGNDRFLGGAGDDVFLPGAGRDRVDGGPGDDLLVLAGPHDAYVIREDRRGVLIRDLSGEDGTDRLADIEQIRFADGTFDLDRLLASA